MIHRVTRLFRLVAVLAAMLIATTLVTPGASFARDLAFAASIIDHQGNLLVVKTSGNELLQLDLGWFKNEDGYALVRDEFFCFQVQEQLNGKLIVTSVVTCDESRQGNAGRHDNEQENENSK